MSNICKTNYLFDYIEDDHGCILEIGIRKHTVIGESGGDDMLVIKQMYNNETDFNKEFELHLGENDVEFIIKTLTNIQKTLKSE